MIPLYDHESEKWLIGAPLTGRGGTKAAADAASRAHARPAERKDSIVHAAASGAARAHRAAERAGRPARRGEPDMAEYLIGCMRFAVSGASAGHYIARLRGLCRARSAYAMASDFCRRLTEGEDVDACTDALRTALRGAGRAIRAHRAHGRAGQRCIRRCGTAVPRRNDRDSDRNSGS